MPGRRLGARFDAATAIAIANGARRIYTHDPDLPSWCAGRVECLEVPEAVWQEKIDTTMAP